MSSTTVCVTDTSVIPFPTLGKGPTYTQSSNTATAPLPHIPCRNARSTPPHSLSDTSISDTKTSSAPDSADYALRSHPATYVRYDSGSSSSSSSTLSDEAPPIIIPRSKRVASQRSLVTDTRDMFTPSTPVKPSPYGRSFALESRKQTPLRDMSDEEDTVRPFPRLKQTPFCKVGKLRLEGSTVKLPRVASESDVTPLRTPATSKSGANPPSPTIRKKSGQPVKSSLKSARRPELHVVTDGSTAKSEPVTPTHTKAVHFDSKLEHVKLFLAEQKPLAVSRDGSPTSDTDGEDFPSFIYENGRHEKPRVGMLVPNMPSSPRKEDNVALQELVLSRDERAIMGKVRVRNIAFEKWVAIRFTLDWWQTTSEVTARYDKSIEGGSFDIFTFTLRLDDIWSRIEDKTIFVALRYTVAGQEFWDNNAGKNYHIKFVLPPQSQPSSAVDNQTNLKDLDSKLEDVAKARSAPIPVPQYRLGRSFSADYQYSSFAKPLTGRYDFASSYKARPVRNTSPPPSRHTRTNTHPVGAPTTAGPTVAPWSGTMKTQEAEHPTTPPRIRLRPPPLSLETPQEAMEDIPVTPPLIETKPPPVDSPNPSRSPDGRERNHRRGYFDRVMEASPNLRRTPTGSPLKFDGINKGSGTQLPRTRSYPFAGEWPGPIVNKGSPTPKPPLSIQTAPVGNGGSQEPTPSQSSSSTASSSASLLSPPPDCSRNDASYKQFIDQFCFYTGSDPLMQESSESVPRSHSASSIAHYFLSHSPPQSMYDMSSRFSFDSSGSTTPTALRAF